MVALQIVRSWMFLSILTITPMRIVWSDRRKRLSLLPIFPRFRAPRENGVPAALRRVGNEGKALSAGVDFLSQG
jgi:hypothetical protein